MNQKTDEPEIDLVDELIAERRDSSTGLPDDMSPLAARLIVSIDKFSLRVGKIVCWMTVPLFTAMVYEVFVRYVFIAPTMWAYDLSRMIYGAMFMLGSGYALMRGVHIRADFLYRLWSPRTQGTVDFFLYFMLYFPGMLIFLWVCSDYAFDAWKSGERGMDSAWMPYLAPARSAMPIGVLLLLIQGVSEALKSYYAMTRGIWP
ncbi:TRAP transporter small permease subunit [Candidatus Persebacteraceae bacterium Df01]|jgi:TRAP-type mannitol/chloroaromatic compound transport system permease small subunit|uniref:TRAP transporter small permease protein n=1 Tax=Candidatus Doriopsillibacter californiensis TaxID=2970740 RepID=A0ABT7QM70_9GAMM|nr:TRAP transporter small permease subunit [Candidatus Persebacteraceae bacterium Df01]